MKKGTVALSCLLLCLGVFADAPVGKHLFILSGQSNMGGLDPNISFVPAVEKAFGAERVIVVKDALGGQPIRRWDKGWSKPIQGKAIVGGDLYVRLMKKVGVAIKGQKIDSVTFVWMQGERDAKESLADEYTASFGRVLAQVQSDLKITELRFVIGRLSDFDMTNDRYPQWTPIRDIQVALAKKNPLGAWVDTDDLNDGVNRKGKQIKNDLHYSVNGYKTLGQRFADAAIQLVQP